MNRFTMNTVILKRLKQACLEMVNILMGSNPNVKQAHEFLLMLPPKTQIKLVFKILSVDLNSGTFKSLYQFTKRHG